MVVLVVVVYKMRTGSLYPGYITLLCLSRRTGPTRGHWSVLSLYVMTVFFAGGFSCSYI